MKQILQNMSNGETTLIDLPVVQNNSNNLLIQTTHSLISIGTEKMLVEFGKANVLNKARQQPEKVKMVLGKVATDGLAATVEAVTSKLSQPMELGYCNVGRVIEVGSNVHDYQEGDRIISNGVHASVVSVPENLTAPIPDNVSDEAASFVVLASIGLQGIRLAEPTLGEYFVVTGLGLIGLLTVQLLRAQGCRVLGIDFDESKLEMARKFGAETVSLGNNEDPVEAGMAFSKGRGVDGVIITASTKSSDPVSQAAQMCRQRGRIVLVGVTGLDLNRSEFYEKELSFQVSCSYGPGRYDPNYEEGGQDYPLGFVRWTERRNFEAILDMMDDGRIDVEPLVSYRYSLDDAIKAYEVLREDATALGILLEYPDIPKDELLAKEVILDSAVTFNKAKPICGFIGAGNYSSRILIPAFVKAGAQMHTVVSRGGVTSAHHGARNKFKIASTDIKSIVESDEINTVAVVTRHNLHAGNVIDALTSGKNVFVEKPLALTIDEVNAIDKAYQDQLDKHGARLMVGYNRRFSPQIQKMKELIDAVKQPKSFIMTMNAGTIPAKVWVQDIKEGGGRIIGEACHFIDLMRYLADSEIISVQARRMGDHPTVEVTEDKAAIILGFKDGSFGTIMYLANGGIAFPKERIEVFTGDAVLQLDNFRKMKGFGWKNFKKMNLMSQDKGTDACVNAFLSSIEKGEACPIPYNEVIEVARISIEIAEQLRNQT